MERSHLSSPVAVGAFEDVGVKYLHPKAESVFVSYYYILGFRFAKLRPTLSKVTQCDSVRGSPRLVDYTEDRRRGSFSLSTFLAVISHVDVVTWVFAVAKDILILVVSLLGCRKP